MAETQSGKEQPKPQAETPAPQEKPPSKKGELETIAMDSALRSGKK